MHWFCQQAYILQYHRNSEKHVVLTYVEFSPRTLWYVDFTDRDGTTTLPQSGQTTQDHPPHSHRPSTQYLQVREKQHDLAILLHVLGISQAGWYICGVSNLKSCCNFFFFKKIIKKEPQRCAKQHSFLQTIYYFTQCSLPAVQHSSLTWITSHLPGILHAYNSHQNTHGRAWSSLSFPLGADKHHFYYCHYYSSDGDIHWYSQ